MLARAPASQLIKAPTTMDPGTTVFLFLYDVIFEKAGFVDRTDRSVAYFRFVAAI